MPENTKRTLREKLIVEAWIKGFENIGAGLTGTILLLFFGGLLGLWYSIFSAIILGGFIYYNLNKSYKAWRLLAIELNAIYLMPLSTTALTNAEWAIYQSGDQKEA